MINASVEFPNRANRSVKAMVATRDNDSLSFSILLRGFGWQSGLGIVVVLRLPPWMLQAAFVESSGLRTVRLLPRLEILVFFSFLFVPEREAFAVAKVVIAMDGIIVRDVCGAVLPKL